MTFDNRYKVLKKIGAGATSTVYKARDLKNNTIIALKILSKDKTSSNVVQHFGREFRLLADLRHPNLCSVYDFGILKDGRSYFTMEYIKGRDIYTATSRSAYERLYPLIAQLCRALEYIHSKGLIHYDVKPSNVFITNTGSDDDENTVKLMDFGLADEQRIKDGALIKGTFPYIAPEVINGRAVDSRTDLYSLGVLLYKICTRKSFGTAAETNFATFLQQQRECIAELPSKVVADMPNRLEQLIMRLLSVEPAARFNRANEVIKEINKFSRKKFRIETGKPIEDYLLGSRFVGRDKEMRKLRALYEQMQHGAGKVILINGEAGIGKSRLLKEFKIITQINRGRAFIGYACKDEIGALEPFHDIFLEIINHIKKSTSLLRSKHYQLPLAVLFKMFPDLRDGHVTKHLPKLVPLEAKAEKLRTFEALSELIRFAAANLGEIVILLEDLHWADELSIQFLDYVGRNLQNENILICGTCRKEELRNNLFFKKMLNNLKHEGRFAEIELKSFNFKDLYSFLDSILTPAFNSPSFTRYLMKKSGGNPFFAEEIMRTLLRTKRTDIREPLDVDDLERLSIPATIEGIVLNRIEGLSNNSRTVVESAALLLRGFEFGIMKALTGLGNTELSRSLWELERKNVFVEEGNKYQFYHAMLAEAVCKKLSYRRKISLYSHIGKTLEKVNRRRLPAAIEDLAYYYINAKDRKKGVSYGLRAAKKCCERYANERAIQYYQGIIGFLDKDDRERRFDVLQELAKYEARVGNHRNAIKHYQNILNIPIKAPEKKIAAYLTLGTLYNERSENRKMLFNYRKAAQSLKRMKRGVLRDHLELNIMLRICTAYQQLGDFKRAKKYLPESVHFPQQIVKNPYLMKLRAGAYFWMADITYRQGEYGFPDYDKVIFYYKKSCRYYKKIDDKVNIAGVFNNLGINYYRKFDLNKVIECITNSLKILREIGDYHMMSIASYNLAHVFMNKGCFHKALEILRNVFALSEKIGNPGRIGDALLLSGTCYANLHNHEKAKTCFHKACRIFNKINWYEKKFYSVLGIGNVYQADGDYPAALRLYKKAHKYYNDIRHQQGCVDSYVNISSVLIVIGRFKKAKGYIDDALKMAINLGAKDNEIECYIQLCRLAVFTGNLTHGRNICRKTIKIAKKLGLKRQLFSLYLLYSEISYHEQKYLKSIKTVSRAVKIAKEMGTRGLLAEALLVKAKSEMKHDRLSTIETSKILDEAKTIAEEIKCPEILWKIYFEFGKFYYQGKEFSNASEYYKKCVGILKAVSSKFKNKAYARSYLRRPDRRAVFNAIDKM